MILLKLFSSFFIIGLVSFGGGYGMISLIRETVIKNGWLTEGELMSFIAVSESTPGPIAVNMATFIGSSQAGILGALLSTLGVVLPSFIIILIIATVLKNLLKYRSVNAFLSGVRPCVIALITATAVTMGISQFGLFSSPDMKSLLVFFLLFVIHFIYKMKAKKNPSPILMIVLSGVMGMGIWGFTG